MALQASWRRLSTTITAGTVQPPRSGAATATDGSGVVYLFGGYAEEDGDKRYATNDLWAFEGGEWCRLQHASSQKGPGPRLCSAAAVVKGELVVFGGWDPREPGTGGVILDDVWALNLETFEWTQVGQMPRGPCSRHVAVAVDETLVVAHTFRCLDSVLAYDATAKRMREIPTHGTAPSPRGLHAAALCGRDFVVFGGADKTGNMRSDAWALDTATWTWRQVVVGEEEEEGPTPRAGASAAALDRNTLLVCCGAQQATTEGGLVPRADLWALHLPTASWTRLLDDDNDVLPPRNAAAFAFLDSSATSASYNDDDDDDDDAPLLDTLQRATTDVLSAADDDEQPLMMTSRFLLHGGWHPFVRTFDDTSLLVVRRRTSPPQ